MFLVIDTNQASFLPRPPDRNWVVSLSPYVLSEILLRTDPTPTLELLRTFPIRLGLETLDVMSQLAQLSPQNIRVFAPFAVSGREYRQDYDAMEAALYGRRETHSNWARAIKNGHIQYCGSLVQTAQQLRRHMRERGIENPRYSGFEEAMVDLAANPDSFLGSVIVSSITDGGNRPTAAQPGELFDAVLANQYLARFFRVLLAYYVSISRVWQDQNLNFDPSPRRDDMTDITLPLYAEDGSVVVTADTKLILLVSLVEPEGRVSACRANEIV